MQAIKDIYRIGNGPSSSHTIAPMRAAKIFLKVNGPFEHYIVDLYGSLALTGKGHKTDRILKEVLGENVTFNFILDENIKYNLLKIEGLRGNEKISWHIESLGGGAIHIKEYPDLDDNREVYDLNHFYEIKDYLKNHEIDLLTYIEQKENDLRSYLNEVLDVMLKSVERGLSYEAVISEDLKVSKIASKLYQEALKSNDDDLKKMAYAYAASEENAMGKIVATAPTLGSCGIVASLMYYSYNDLKISKDKLISALAIGGMFGNMIKQNATISGALGGCQAEVGSACAMASAMIAYLNGDDLDVIEYAAEIGIEHHLGLTCDPVKGYVIIPCIERNAVAILRSFDAAKLSKNLLKFRNHLVTFDMVVSSMNYTGQKLSPELKETSLGGLALEFKEHAKN